MSEKNVVMIPEPLVEQIRVAGNVILLTHVHPDGDALGSSLALAEILESIGKRCVVFLEEPISYLYDFLPGQQRINTSIEEVVDFSASCQGDLVVVALDTGDAKRLGKFTNELLQLSPMVVLDHHQSHKDYGDMRWVEPTMSSTGEMVYELSMALNAAPSYDAAVNLYVAICTDTGSFRYDSTGARTLQIAAELVAKGVKPATIAKELYDNVSHARLRLLKRVLNTMQLEEDGKLAYIHVTQQMITDSGASMDDVDGFVDYPRSLQTVKVAVFLKEKYDGQIAVSLRAKGECDVAEVASCFEGGGHRNAAGFRVSDLTISGVKEMVHKELRQRI